MKLHLLTVGAAALVQLGYLGVTGFSARADSISFQQTMVIGAVDQSVTSVPGANDGIPVKALKVVRSGSASPLTPNEKQKALGKALHASNPAVSVSSDATLTPAKASVPGIASFICYFPVIANYGKGGEFGPCFLRFAATSATGDSEINFAVNGQAGRAYVFELTLSQNQCTGSTSTFTIVSRGAMNETATEPVSALNGPKLHLSFVVTPSTTGKFFVSVNSPDTFWQFYKCEISSSGG